MKWSHRIVCSLPKLLKLRLWPKLTVNNDPKSMVSPRRRPRGSPAHGEPPRTRTPARTDPPGLPRVRRVAP